MGQEVRVFAQQALEALVPGQLEREANSNHGQAVRVLRTNGKEVGDLISQELWGFRYDFKDADEVFLHTPNSFTVFKQMAPPPADDANEVFLPVSVQAVEKPSQIWVHLCRRGAPRGTRLSPWRMEVNRRVDQLEGRVFHLLQKEEQPPLFPETNNGLELEPQTACLARAKLSQDSHFHRGILLGFSNPEFGSQESTAIVQLVDSGYVADNVPLRDLRQPLFLEVPCLTWKVQLAGLRRRDLNGWNRDDVIKELMHFCADHNPMYLKVTRVPQDGGLIQGQLYMDAAGTRSWLAEERVRRLIVDLRADEQPPSAQVDLH